MTSAPGRNTLAVGPGEGGAISGNRSVAALLMVLGALLVMTRAGRSEQTATPPDVVVLRGCPLGGVLFAHKIHAENYAGGRCETCHHPSRSEKPASAPQQACRSCHVKPPQPPMKTDTQAAFHNPAGTSGTCIDCHVRMNAADRKPPLLCMQCHKREND